MLEKLFRVKLNNPANVHATNVVDGYLGNSFGSGKVEEYTRGEAIKKARMFDGKIEAREFKCIFIDLQEISEDGTRVFSHKSVHEVLPMINIIEFGNNYAKSYSGHANELITVNKVVGIDYKTFKTLKELF